MAEHAQRHAALVYVAESAVGALSEMKGLIYFFANYMPGITDPKSLTLMELHVVTNYSREAYLTVSLLLICDHSVYGKII